MNYGGTNKLVLYHEYFLTRSKSFRALHVRENILSERALEISVKSKALEIFQMDAYMRTTALVLIGPLSCVKGATFGFEPAYLHEEEQRNRSTPCNRSVVAGPAIPLECLRSLSISRFWGKKRWPVVKRKIACFLSWWLRISTFIDKIIFSGSVISTWRLYPTLSISTLDVSPRRSRTIFWIKYVVSLIKSLPNEPNT